MDKHIYAFVRHPLFWGYALFWIGIGLWMRSPGRVILAALLGPAFAAWAKLVEEPRLASAFGERYEDYRRSVPGLFPRWAALIADAEELDIVALLAVFLVRLLALCEQNYNLVELGPRGTGKSYGYQELSPYTILLTGPTTVANLFYNMASKTVGLVGLWDCVAFDEVAGITFKDKDGVQIMKDYMASGSFARGKEQKAAYASMVFVGNINQSVDTILRTSHLFEPFPEAMSSDTAFFDRMHCYNPGWEITKYRPESFTDDYGFITDYFAGFLRELRKTSYGDLLDRHFKLGRDLNQRDVISVRKMVSGLIKIVYPNGEIETEQLEEILRFALESRRRVKEQLKKIGGMAFYDGNFSYLDNESLKEDYVSVPEQGGGKLIPEGIQRAGHVYTVAHGRNGMIGVYKLETEVTPGTGTFERTGLGSDREVKEAIETAYQYLKLNRKPQAHLPPRTPIGSTRGKPSSRRP